MEYAQIEALRERHPAWRMLRATHAPLLLTVLGRFFVEEGRGASSEGELVAALDDQLYAINSQVSIWRLGGHRMLRSGASSIAVGGR